MTGAEARARRNALGYTQEEIGQLLGCSKPTVSRREDKAAEKVPEEHAATLQRLSPKPEAEARKVQQRATPPVVERRTERRPPTPRPPQPARTVERPLVRPVAPPAPQPEGPERVYEAEEIGALLLEVPEASSPLRDRWLRAKEGRQAALIRILASGRRPCQR